MVTGDELIIEWARGWSISRGTPPPAPAGKGVRIALREPGGAERHVLPVFDRVQIARLAAEVTGAGSEIKVLGDSAELIAALGGGWASYPACELMTTSFTRSRIALPGGCRFRVARDRATAVAMITCPSGEIAAAGRLAPVGRHGVVDQVETRAQHRRRGLATAVMALLGNWAVDNDLDNGLLSATREGQALYHHLGWTTRGEVAGAVRSPST